MQGKFDPIPRMRLTHSHRSLIEEDSASFFYRLVSRDAEDFEIELRRVTSLTRRLTSVSIT